MEQQIKIAAKLYECRDVAKRFLQGNFKSKIEPYKVLILQVMHANKCNELEAILMISKTNAYNDSGFRQMMFMAAAVELIEPSV